MTDYTAKIKAKGLDATGVTEDIARGLYSNLGKSMMFIVEGRVDSRAETTEGVHQVQLSLTMVEPATDDALAEHLRELSRTVYQNRAVAEGQLAIEDSLTPSITDAVAAGAQHRPHPFLPVDAADDNGICDVCGQVQKVGVHFEDFADPFEVPTQPDENLADPDDPDVEPTLDDELETSEADPVPTT